jgi:hypothetical protein
MTPSYWGDHMFALQHLNNCSKPRLHLLRQLGEGGVLYRAHGSDRMDG